MSKRFDARFIPARAGRISSAIPTATCSTVHPRTGGADAWFGDDVVNVSGSSHIYEPPTPVRYTNSMREPLAEGYFWRTDHPETRVSGKLFIPQEGGGRLELTGSTGRYGLFDDERRVFLGDASGRLFTVAGCSRTRWSATGEEWRADSVLEGGHFADPESAMFDRARIAIADMQHWIGETALRVEVSEDSTRADLKYEEPEQPAVDTAFGSVKVVRNAYWTGDRFIAWGIRQACGIEFRFAPRLPLSEILRYCTYVQQLVTLGLGWSVKIRSLALFRDRTSSEASSYKLHRRGWDPNATDIDREDYVHEFSFFWYGDVGAVGGLSRWLDMATAYQVPISQLTATIETHLAPEIVLFFVCTAAEAYERIAKDKGKGDLRRALLHLTDLEDKRSAYAPGAYETDSDPTPILRRWAGKVADARNEVVHPTANGIPPERIRGYAEHVYRLVVLALLERIDINPEVLARLDYETNIPDFHIMGPWANVSR